MRKKYKFRGEEISVELMPTSIGHEDCEPRHAFGPGERNTYLIHYVLRGCGVFSVGGKTYHVGTGEAFLICPRELVYYEADDKTPWSYTWIGFSGFKAEECIRQTILPERRVFRYSNEELYHCQQRLVEALQVGAGRELMLASVLYEYLYLLLRHYGRSTRRETVIRYGNQYVKQIKEYIASSYAEGVQVSDVAEYLQVDRSYLFRLFKEETGKSLQEYLIEFRLRKACELLRMTDYPIGTVACSVGYTDPFYFARLFHKRVGVSPTVYRRACQTERE
ncbi:AraC family transcriptional regulator [Selenomonas bovis]|nr:AraC family transcriptional regulator [Selenomonas bovis]